MLLNEIIDKMAQTTAQCAEISAKPAASAYISLLVPRRGAVTKQFPHKTRQVNQRFKHKPLQLYLQRKAQTIHSRRLSEKKLFTSLCN
ncbi:hypothetical protein EXN66_Car012120 [Channa argus]|uniref:Uncharacterized protein n=1 Tax=Channa argus TaxID=215402 RepID=A0A6G1Q1R2_CHAAH|nr:hypothetical protein EXN66_Car012120 [Channa argus]